MLSVASRRSISRIPSTSSCSIFPDLRCFVVGSSKDLEHPLTSSRHFSSSSSAEESVKVKLSKAKSIERGIKLEKKRNLRAIKAVKSDNRVEEARLVKSEKVLEVSDKFDNAQILTEGLEPFTESELEGMYLGLIEATPSELALPSLTPSSNLLLEEPIGTEERFVRVEALEARLEVLEADDVGLLETEAVDTVKGSGGLSDRLKVRRGGVVENEGVQESSVVTMTTESSTRKILNKLEAYVNTSAIEFGDEETTIIPLGIAVKSEWKDLILSLAEEGDREGVKKGLTLLQRAIPTVEGEIFTAVMSLYATEGRSRDALDLVQFAKSAAFPVSLVTHHYLMSSLLPSHPVVAISYLHSLEKAGYTPLLETYTVIIRDLLKAKSTPQLVARGWDLYAHTRLVAHPTPDVALFSTMIQACSRGSNPSPERAIDLFTEMTVDNGIPPSEEAYNGVIRACACEGSQESYFEALRFMRQMLDANVNPSKHTFHALLEGARRHGDLARARWMLVKMVEVGGESTPDTNTIGRVFQTYASYKVPIKGPTKNAIKKKSSLSSTSSTTTSKRSESSTINSNSNRKSSKADPVSFAGTQTMLEVMGESSLSYPGPLPQTSEELLAEARVLMLQIVPLSILEIDSPPISAFQQRSNVNNSLFPSVIPSTFLFNSYLELLAVHAPLPITISFFDHAFETAQVGKNRFTYERMIHQCEMAKNKELGMRTALKTFGEWRDWMGDSEKVKLSKARKVEGFLIEEEIKVKDGTGKNISNMWGSMIRNLARNFAQKEGLNLLHTFIATYPPKSIITHSTKLRQDYRFNFPSFPSPIRLANISYPETTTSKAIDRPPYLLYNDLKILHMRFANVQDNKSVATVMAIAKAFEGAVKEATELEEGTRKRYKNVIIDVKKDEGKYLDL